MISKDFIQVHVPRTGGSVIRDVLAKSSSHKWFDEYQQHDTLKQSYRKLKKLLPATDVEAIPSFTFVRNPWDWYVSRYFFRVALMSKGGGKAPPVENGQETPDADGFRSHLLSIRRALRKGIGGTQYSAYQWLALSEYHANMVCPGVDYIGRFEYLAEDFLSMANSLGFQMDNLAEEMTRFVESSDHEQYKYYYTPDLIEMVARWDAKYIKSFGYMFREPSYLEQFGKQVYSQNGEDGMIEKLFELIGEQSKFYVEFGAADGDWLSNTRYLREKGWTGVLMDCEYHNPNINLFKIRITAENVNEIFAQHVGNQNIDLLSIDVDGNDWWIWHALQCKPRVVIIEYNRHLPADKDMIIKYNPDHEWDHTNYYSASILSYLKLARSKGYSLVGACCSNLFFVLDDELSGELPTDLLKEVNKVDRHYEYANSQRPDPQKRPYVESSQVL